MMKQYILHKKIGEGGYSSVYKCTDNIGVRYACKVMPKLKNKRFMVENEINAMKALSFSSKVVKFVEACENDDNYYIIQEWCRGGTVKDYLERTSKRDMTFSENTAASFLRGVLRGLCHMHSVGIIHRDIKAGNIFVGDTSDDADVKIGDLGTALIIDSDFENANKRGIFGTPWFMAPENLRCEWYYASDIWSMGVFGYNLLTGEMPFNDVSNPYHPRVSAVWKSILTDKPQFDGKIWEGVSSEAKDFVKMCLIKDYQGRPSARECLFHSWLLKTDCNDRFKGDALNCQPFKFESLGFKPLHDESSEIITS